MRTWGLKEELATILGTVPSWLCFSSIPFVTPMALCWAAVMGAGRSKTFLSP